MSVIWSNEYGWMVCHSSFLHRIYGCIENERLCSTCGRYRIFHINEPFLKRGQRSQGSFISAQDNNAAVAAAASNSKKKQTQDPEDANNAADDVGLGTYAAGDFKSNEIAILRTVVDNFMRDLSAAKVEYFAETKCRHPMADNFSATNLANAVMSRATRFNGQADHFDGGNSNDHAVVARWNDETFFIPPRCRFYNYDIDRMSEKLRSSIPYDFILIDPPWQNKHVKRKNASSNGALGYNLMGTDSIAALAIDECLAADGLLAVWCTNSSQQIDDLVNRLFPRWKIEYSSTWYWIKVTRTAQPVCQFSVQRPNRKQPYERIIFACRPHRRLVYKNPPPNKILVSIPSAIHSHKPPLADVLKEYLPADGRCIELFARYLLPNWTSYGNQVLKLQTSALFSD